MRNLIMEKGISQINHFLMALRTEGITQELSLIAISWMQLLAGTSFPVFHDVSIQLPHLFPMKWLPFIRNFLNKNDLKLEVSLDCIPCLQRLHDAFLMDTHDKVHLNLMNCS